MKEKSPNQLSSNIQKAWKSLDSSKEGERLNHCIELKKSMYGNVDAVLKFFQTYSSHLLDAQGMAMKQSQAEWCVFMKELDNEWFKSGIKTRFKYTDEGKLKKHLGIEGERRRTVYCGNTGQDSWWNFLLIPMILSQNQQ